LESCRKANKTRFFPVAQFRFFFCPFPAKSLERKKRMLQYGGFSDLIPAIAIGFGLVLAMLPKVAVCQWDPMYLYAGGAIAIVIGVYKLKN
jgi:hypothetical protein